MNLSNLCRSCMKELSQSSMETLEQNSVNMFIFCTGIQVMDRDEFPKHFCSDCTSQLKSSYHFIKHAQEINATLQELVFKNRGIFNNDYLEVDTKSEIKPNDMDNIYETTSFENTEESKQIISNNNYGIEIKMEENSFKPEGPISKKDIKIFKTRKIQKILSKYKNMHERENKSEFKNMKDNVSDYAQNSYIYTCNISSNLPNNINNVKQRCNENVTCSNNDDINSEMLNTPDSDSEDDHESTIITSKLQSNNTEANINETGIADSKTCPICKKTYTNDTFLKKHLKKKHKKSELVFPLKEEDIKSLIVKDKSALKNRDAKCCPLCNKAFKLQTHFNKHLEREHLSDKQYCCPYCTTICSTPSSLRHHKSKHSEDRRFACNACGKRFRKRKGLAVHALTHSDDRPFICDFCHKSFKMKQVLIKHIRLHENKQGRFLCHICAKSFNNQYNLQEHMPKHTGERSFACAQCSYTTAYRVSLRRHELRHNNDRPHVCPHCQKAFFEQTGLRRHMRIHTGEKPIRCPSCSLTFIDHWKRKTHIMRVHQVPFGEIPRLAADGQTITNW